VSWRDVKHQPHAQRVIRRALRADRVAHAYVFLGPDGVGKESFALGLAEVLLCPAPVERRADAAGGASADADSLPAACGRCEDCRMTAAQSHPDLHLIYRQLNRSHPDPDVRKKKALEIGVDVLRHFVIDRVGLTPQRARHKVFIIREADRITSAAQNALLKTLEEPPADTILILCVSAVDRLLPTTLSRCQLVRFDPLPGDFVRERLAELLPDMPADRVEWYTRRSDGSIGLAIEQAADELFDVNERILDGLERMTVDDGAARAGDWFEEAKSLGPGYRKRDPEVTESEAQRRGLQAVFRCVADWYADVLRRRSQMDAVVNQARRTQIERVAKGLADHRAVRALNRIALAEWQLERNGNAQLVAETLAADIVRLTAGR